MIDKNEAPDGYLAVKVKGVLGAHSNTRHQITACPQSAQQAAEKTGIT